MSDDNGLHAAVLTHFDDAGNAVMVDVGAKSETNRVATAYGSVFISPETTRLITSRGLKKGDVLSVAQLAGIMGAKKTPDIIPLCHPVSLTFVSLTLTVDPSDNRVIICSTCKTAGKTGVEMEALTAVSVAALTVYDMCKAVDKQMRISDIRLTYKAGGKSGVYEASSSC